MGTQLKSSIYTIKQKRASNGDYWVLYPQTTTDAITDLSAWAETNAGGKLTTTTGGKLNFATTNGTVKSTINFATTNNLGAVFTSTASDSGTITLAIPNLSLKTSSTSSTLSWELLSGTNSISTQSFNFDKASLVVNTNKLYAKYVSAFALGTTTETTQPLVLTNNLGGTTSSLSLSLLSATETKAGLMSKQLFLDLRNALPKNPNGTDNLIGTDNKIVNTYLPDFLLGQVLYGGTIDGSGVCSLSENFISKYKITTLTITKNESNTYEGVFFIATASLNLSATTGFDSISLATGDWLISNGGEGYNKIDNTDAVTGVKGNAESTYRIGNVNITPTNIGLGNVVNTGDSATPVSGGTTKFTTGGAFTELAKKQNTLTAGTNVTIDANSKISVNIEPADYASANTQLNGLTIDGINYKLLDVKVNDLTNLIIGNNRSLASGASGAIAIGACNVSTASGLNSVALGYGSKASGDYSTALGCGSSAIGSTSTAIGYGSRASAGNSVALGNVSMAYGFNSVALGYNSVVYVPNWVGFDGTDDDLVRTIALKSTDNIFFRNENVDNAKTTQASYTSGKTLTQVLDTKQDILTDIVTAGTYSTVSVNAKGLVTKGEKSFAVGETVGASMPTDLSIGGLFFDLVSEIA